MSTPDSQEFREAQEQYRWLGQQARQINLYRTSALRQLHMLYALPYNKSKTNLEKLKEIYKLADQSASWAQNIGDPCRTAKSKLVCLEVLKAIANYNPSSTFMSSLPNETHILSSDGSPLISTEDAWTELSKGEVSPWCSLPTHRLYKLIAHGTRLRHRRLRLLALSFLETS
jgi:hypothetical protein